MFTSLQMFSIKIIILKNLSRISHDTSKMEIRGNRKEQNGIIPYDVW